MADPIHDYLAAIGRRGGKANTAAQNAARARNGKLGGRPPKRRKRSRHNAESEALNGLNHKVAGDTAYSSRAMGMGRYAKLRKRISDLEDKLKHAERIGGFSFSPNASGEGRGIPRTLDPIVGSSSEGK